LLQNTKEENALNFNQIDFGKKNNKVKASKAYNEAINITTVSKAATRMKSLIPENLGKDEKEL
jgi:hypothetical protein